MEAVVLLILFGGVLLIGLATWAGCSLYDCLHTRRRNRIYAKNPDLTELINEYNKKVDNYVAFSNANICPLRIKERTLREKIPTATKQEYETISETIETIKQERSKQEAINDEQNNYQSIHTAIINKIKSLPVKDSTFLFKYYWQE